MHISCWRRSAIFSYGATGDDLRSSGLSRIEQKLLYAAGVFFVLTIVFSTFSIASTILSTVSLNGSLEKAMVTGMGVATALVAALLGYWIDRKATFTREECSHLGSATRLLLLGAVFGGAVCLAVIVALAIGPFEHIYLLVLASATLCVAGLFGCLFGSLFQARVAKQSATGPISIRLKERVPRPN